MMSPGTRATQQRADGSVSTWCSGFSLGPGGSLADGVGRGAAVGTAAAGVVWAGEVGGVGTRAPVLLTVIPGGGSSGGRDTGGGCSNREREAGSEHRAKRLARCGRGRTVMGRSGFVAAAAVAGSGGGNDFGGVDGGNGTGGGNSGGNVGGWTGA